MPGFFEARTIYVLNPRATEFVPVQLSLDAAYALDKETFANRACNKARSLGAAFFIIPTSVGGRPTRYRAYIVADARCGLDTTDKDAAEMWCIHRAQVDA
jgi:hypothetical protein